MQEANWILLSTSFALDLMLLRCEWSKRHFEIWFERPGCDTSVKTWLELHFRQSDMWFRLDLLSTLSKINLDILKNRNGLAVWTQPFFRNDKIRSPKSWHLGYSGGFHPKNKVMVEHFVNLTGSWGKPLLLSQHIDMTGGPLQRLQLYLVCKAVTPQLKPNMLNSTCIISPHTAPTLSTSDRKSVV